MMKRISLGIFVVAAVLTQQALADATPSPSPSSDQIQNTTAVSADDDGESMNRYLSEACIVDKSDPYDIGETMHKGAFKGQCMDISSRGRQ